MIAAMRVSSHEVAMKPIDGCFMNEFLKPMEHPAQHRRVYRDRAVPSNMIPWINRSNMV